VKSLSAAAARKLLSHHWPGNVRELKNVIERALILERAEEIQSASLPDFQVEAQLHKSAMPKITGNESLDELVTGFERQLIADILERNGFNLGKTAEQLKISRHALRYRMQRLNLNLPGEAEDEKAAGVGKEISP
jgi:DNA-binding NtrC family response regulator